MKIISVPSPNFASGRRGYHPEAIVIHIMEGTLSGTDSWFRNPQSSVSAHYGVGAGGEVHQYVQETDTAWHAGRVHAPTWTSIKPSGTGSYVNPNYYTIGIEHEGNEQSEWNDAMYDATSDLLVEINKRWNIPLDRSHIVGHREIYSLKTCPGFKVDLPRLVSLSRRKGGLTATSTFVSESGKVATSTNLNLRRISPSTQSPIARRVNKGAELVYTGYTDNGEKIKDTSRWYQTSDGLWFWGGGIADPQLAVRLPHQPINYVEMFPGFGDDGNGVKVCVLDSGFYNHAAFCQEVKAVADFTQRPGPAEDSQGHGTHVAGIIGARLRDSIFPAVGVAPACELMAGKVIPDEDDDKVADSLANGIKWAMTEGAKILNLSLSIDEKFRPRLKPLLKEAARANIIIVAAAGSVRELDNKRVQYPASDFENCISVGSVSKTYLSTKPSINPSVHYLSGYSHYLSTSIPTYDYYKADIGSSMATAFVSGLIARMLSRWKREGKNIDTISRKEVLDELDRICVPRETLNFQDYSQFRIAK